MSEQEAKALADEIRAAGEDVLGVQYSNGLGWFVDVGHNTQLLQFFSRTQWLEWLRQSE